MPIKKCFPAALCTFALLLLAGCGSTTVVTAPTVTPVALATASVTPAVMGHPYNVGLRAVNGSQPYVFSLASGSLPAGVTLQPSGTISGKATLAGSYPFVAQVADSETPQSTATQAMTLVVALPLSVPTSALTQGQVASAYSMQLLAGGISPYSFTVTTGAVPAGMSLTSSGALAGTPTAAGPATFGATVRDSSGQTATGTFTLTIMPVPLAVAPLMPVIDQVGTAFKQAISATGGTAPYTFTLASGTLPTGVSLAADGTLSGTMSGGGIYTPTIQVADSATPAQTISTSLSLTVFDAAVLVDPSNILATVPPTAFGIHTSVYDPSLSDTAALPALLSAAGIKMMRYPGGSYSDNYHWAQYTMTPIFASTGPVCGVMPSGYLAPKTDFGNFVRTLQATGTQAIITVNYGSSLADAQGTKSTSSNGPHTCSEPNTSGQPQEAAAWVAYANGDPASTQIIGVDAVGFDWKTVGYWASLRAATPLATDDGFNFLRLGLTAPVGIKYWEIGNEVYYNGYNSNNNAESDIHAPYLYEDGYPGAYESRNGMSALSPSAYGANAAQYVEAMRAVDPTIKLGVVVSSAIDPIPSTWTPAVLSSVCASATVDFAIVHYYPGTYNATTADQLLSSPQSDMPNIVSGVKSNLARNCPASSAAAQVFVTETNPDGAVVPGMPAAIPGLFAAHEILTSLEAGVSNIEWLELHAGAGTFLAPTTETPGPAFYGIELAHLMANPGDALVGATSSSGTVLAHASRQANGTRAILLINADPAHPATVELTVQGGGVGGTATTYSYGINTTQSGTALTTSIFPITGSTMTVAVPAYTAVEVQIP